MDSQNYQGWLTSDKFWKRALAVFGYYSVIQIPLAIIITVLMYLLK